VRPNGGDNGTVSTALPAPTFAGLVTEWTWQPVALALAVALAVWYARGVHRLRQSGNVWPRGRVVLFGTGLAAFVWVTCGFAGAYLDSLFWVWTSQQLALLLVVPYLIMAGQPLQLAGTAGRRMLRTRFVRVLGNPLIGPALVPLVSVALFFGPVPGWSIEARPFGWFEQVVVLVVGALIVLPLVVADPTRTSLAVGISLAIGMIELVLDAVPGIALRLHKTVSTSYFDFRAASDWAPGPVHDQQIGGAILWCVAELLDLPFLVLVFVLWLKADERDAAEVDAVLDAERIARGEHEPTVEGEAGPTDAPWWLTDPAMRERMQRPH
jgi:cytochrome c oxidase assembly factor CtaG